jgi:nucleotide-binding universal stress UspA family protein
LAKYSLAVTTIVAIDPDVAEAIVLSAEQGQVDFIAMATHGRGGVQHWALGSISERVLHATRLPLLIVRPPDVIAREQRASAQPTAVTIKKTVYEP